MSGNVSPITRFVFYAFVMSIPFETAFLESTSSIGTLSMMVGLALAGVVLLEPRSFFKAPPGAFWCFGGYVFVYLVLGMTQDLRYSGPMLTRLLTLLQMLFLVWISCNLFMQPEICKGALLAFVISCAILSGFQIAGVGAADMGQGRSSVFGEHANTLGAILGLAMIALVGITYGRARVEWKRSLLAWMVFPILGTALIMTGSRGSLLGVVVALALLIVRDGGWGAKVKIGLVTVGAMGFLFVAAMTDEAMRARIENSLYDRDVAGRDQILAAAWDMFLEKPLLGWGPVINRFELGSRVGWVARDAHNLFLSVLIETGLLGAIPFFAGLLLSLRSAWRARSGSEGSLPIAMVTFLMAINMSVSWHNRKLFWLTMAYALASAWSVRGATSRVAAEFQDPLKVMDSSSGAPSSFSQVATRVTGTASVRQRQQP